MSDDPILWCYWGYGTFHICCSFFAGYFDGNRQVVIISPKRSSVGDLPWSVSRVYIK